MDSAALYHETPLLLSRPLSRLLKRKVYLKLENLQPTGAFKNRAMGTLCQYYKEQGAKKFVSSSGGNAGLAAAYSGAILQIPVEVIVPETTPSMMREKIMQEGAKVRVYGSQWSESDELARKLVAEEDGSYYIPPFDHPKIWEGNATMVQEIVSQGVLPGAVVLSVGGGGLLCGVAEGLEKAGCDNTAIIASEPDGAASLRAALQAKEVVALDHVQTIATSLAAKQVTPKVLEYAAQRNIISEVVTDKAALDACFRFLEDHFMLVEPACGVALAPLYGQFPSVLQYDSIVVIVCGGQVVSLDLLYQWQKKVANE
jgi:L-serine/L-threonine ammonia-lyase